MSFSDQDEPRGSNRRRGRGKDDFDDFWTRDNGGTPGRGRKRGDARSEAPEPGDVSDLAGDAPVTPPRRGRPRTAPPDAAPAPLSRRGSAPPGRDRGAAARAAGPPPRASATPPRGAQPYRRPGPGPAAGAGTAGDATAPVPAVAAPRPRRVPQPGSRDTGENVPARRPVGAQAALPPHRRAPGAGSPAPGTPGPRDAGSPGWSAAGQGSPSPAAAARRSRPVRPAARDLTGEHSITASTRAVPFPGTGEMPALGGYSPGQPGFGTPRRGDPGFGDPGGDAAFGDPGFGGPGFGEPRRGDPGAGQSGPGRSGFGAPPWADDPSDGGFGADDYGDDTYYEDEDDFDDGDVGEDELPNRRGCRNALIVLLVIALVAAGGAWYGWTWVQGKIDPAGGQGDEVLVEIPEGTSTSEIGALLADAGVISDARVWDWYTKLRDVGTIQAGSYRMQVNSSFTEAIDDLGRDPLPPDSRLVTIPEGLTQAQIAARLVDPEKGVPGFTPQGVKAALVDPASRSTVVPPEQPLLEGVLFPETYAVEEGDTELIVVRRMVDEFEEVAEDVKLEERAAALRLTPYEVLIVASMVEREAGTPEDGPRVARVIYNRLARDMPLGIDATSCYEEGGIPCQLTTAILEDNSPYDTRTQTGLPPTPIASPGRAAIEAALAPAEGDWIYYVLDVRKDDGSSLFTSSEDEFLEAKERCVTAGKCG